MILKEKPNRLLIYFFYDRDGIADSYIPYMLDDMKENVSDMIIVVNGALNDAGRSMFSSYTDKVIERENKGFDVWAYKTALDSLGWQKLADYDEVILMNFTMMGPVYPFRNMFDTMSKKDLDFWGITQFYKTDFDPWGGLPDGYIPDHIQSHFIAVRSSLLNSDAFHDYWDNMPMITGYLDSVMNHESRFTKHFEKAGFKWEVYCDAKEFAPYSYQPAVGMAKRMIDEYKCPIFKRRSFMQDYDVILNESCGQEAYELYKYLDEKTDYDMNLIWDNLLRVENQADLKKNLQWNYILSSTNAYNKDAVKDRRIALVMHIHFLDLVDECARYADSMPEGTDMFITTNSQEKKAAIVAAFSKICSGKLDVRTVPNKGRDVGPFLVEFRPFLDDYDYVCHVHDKKAGQSKPGSIGLSFAYKCFENTLKSREYVLNVLDVFEKNERAGLLSPPPPNHSDYFFTLGLEWGTNYENTAKLAKELGINVSIRQDKEPVAPLGSFFFARAKALKPLFAREWTYDDFPDEPVADDGTILHAVERIYPFSAQAAGFYPGWILAESGAAMEITNLNHMLRQLNNVIFFRGSDAGGYIDVLKNLNQAYNEAIETRMRSFKEGCEAKLYIDNGKAGFSEETAKTAHSVCTYNEDKSKITSHSWTFTFPDKDWIKTLRFDPCDYDNVALNSFKLEVEDIAGRVYAFTTEEAGSNGVKLADGSIAFLLVDPQVVFSLKNKLRAKEVRVSALAGKISQDQYKEISELASTGGKKKK